MSVRLTAPLTPAPLPEGEGADRNMLQIYADLKTLL